MPKRTKPNPWYSADGRLIHYQYGIEKISPMNLEPGYTLVTFRYRGSYPVDLRPGKWLIFVNVDDVDEIWEKLRRATENGYLGNVTKVSGPDAKNKGSRVFEVYTYDHRDKKDVIRVRWVLKFLGFKRPIPYKVDGSKATSKYFE